MNPGIIDVYCSFCGHHQAVLERLIAGPSAYICDRCSVTIAAFLRTGPRATSGTCSFCGRSAHQVALAVHDRASICEECLGVAAVIVAEEQKQDDRKEHQRVQSVEAAFKYHGIGNDFVILDRRSSGRDIDAAVAVKLCDRRRGIGADGVLVILPSETASAKMVVHNADGSIAEMCGNGLRCAVKFLVDQLERKPDSIDVETGAGVLSCAIDYVVEQSRKIAREIEVDMGPARLVAPNLPSGKTNAPFIDAAIPGHPELRGSAVSMGNPHLVLSNAHVEDVEKVGPALERHPDFPDRTNVEFVSQDGDHLTVAVWERGSGFTQACGTGACAAVAAWVHRGLLPAETWIPVDLPGGQLRIHVAKDLSKVRLRGPAEFVFSAQVPV